MKTVTLTPEALDWLKRGRLSLITAGPSGHFGANYWGTSGGQRCVWGHIIGAIDPGHPRDTVRPIEVYRYETDTGDEIDRAYEAFHGCTIDAHSHCGYELALAALEDLILAASRMPDWVPSETQGSQHEQAGA